MIVLRQKGYSIGGVITGSTVGGTSGILLGRSVGKNIGRSKAENSYDPEKYISELEAEITKDEKTLRELKKSSKRELEDNYDPEKDPEEYERSIEYKKKQIEKIKKNPESGRKDYAAKHYNTKYENYGKFIGGSLGALSGGLGGHMLTK